MIYGYTRLTCFQQCPLKFKYNYVEGIETGGNKYVLLGSLFHEALAEHYRGKDVEPVFKKYRKAVRHSQLDTDEDLLEYMIDLYIGHYKDSYRNLAIEYTFSDKLLKGDVFEGTTDRVFEDESGNIILLDTKTTQGKLKYTPSMVRTNPQLLLYVPFVQSKLGITVSGICIDEVRMARLQEVPINKNGRPTIDKGRLELVTYEKYLTTLQSMGLETYPEYQNTLEYLSKRGHPLFSRIQYGPIEKNLIDSNLLDFQNTYKTAREGYYYRKRGPLCNFCDYSELCQMDAFGVSELEREMHIKHISTPSQP